MHRLTACLLLALAPAASGQRNWLDPMPGSGAALLTSIGFFDDNVTDSPITSVAVRGRYAMPGNVTIVAELPAVRAQLLNGFSGTSVGNPWVGLEFGSSSAMQFEFGARLSLWSPHTQDRALAQSYGHWLDFDRREAWYERTWAIRAMAHFGQVPAEGGFVTAKLGAAGLAMGATGADGELVLRYGGRAGFATAHWIGWVGINGEGLVTEATGSVADRTLHQGEVAIATRGTRWRFEMALHRFVGETFASSMPVVIRVMMVATP
jgi:hypothetical protein